MSLVIFGRKRTWRTIATTPATTIIAAVSLDKWADNRAERQPGSHAARLNGLSASGSD